MKKITLPPKINETQQQEFEFDNLVIVGANGSGKTRFGSYIEQLYIEDDKLKIYRVPAQKLLSIPEEVQSRSIDGAQRNLWYGENVNNQIAYYKSKVRYNGGLCVGYLDDYEKLLVLLHSKATECMYEAKARNEICKETELDQVIEIWEQLLPERKLKIRSGTIESFPTDNKNAVYNAKELSDGERVIFYLIGQSICAPKNSIIIIDEPELHIHKSIVRKLYDLIENTRKDCSFVYLTHDIDFATSRQNANKIWIKSFDGNAWDYKVLQENNEIPEQLYLEILGSRKPILFIEGNNDSIDKQLLECVFNDKYTVKSLGSCNKVFSTTKAFNDEHNFHYILAKGLIDRDRRTDEEIENISDENIWVAKVAEIENFLLLKEVVKAVALDNHKEKEQVFSNVKNNVVSFFNEQKEQQALEHSKYIIERKLKELITSQSKTIEEFKSEFQTSISDLDLQEVYDETLNRFQELINNKDYEGILKVFNNKGLLARSKVAELCDLNNKNNAYLNRIITLLKLNNNISAVIKNEIKKYIENINS